MSTSPQNPIVFPSGAPTRQLAAGWGLLALAGCTQEAPLSFEPRVATVCECVCLDPPCVCGVDSEGPGSDSLDGSETSTASEESTSSESSDSSDSSSGGGSCPDIVDGLVEYAPGFVAEVRNAGPGPLFIWLHGTTRTPLADIVDVPVVGAMLSQPVTTVIPWSTPETYTPGAHPLWDGEPAPYQTHPWTERDPQDVASDLDAIIACTPATEVYVAGMSNGGIMTSRLLELRAWVDAAAIWSGGQTDEHTTVALNPDLDVLVFHGGPNDVYACVPGDDCYPGFYAFEGPSVQLANDLGAAGHDVALCDHNGGHSTHGGPEGAEFLRDTADPPAWLDWRPAVWGGPVGDDAGASYWWLNGICERSPL